MIKVSVIIPVYNVEQYLEKCLDSLLGQTLEEIEFIAVNDGATDGSQKILDEYLKKSDRLRCFKKENGGLSDARNYGFQFAKGEYIGYVDSDDFVDEDMFRAMYDKAKETDSDVVECNIRHTFPDNSEDEEIVERFYDRDKLLCFGRHVVWNKIYRRTWLMDTRVDFPVGLIYEDVAFFCKLVPYICRYAYVDIAPIHYVQRVNSINNSASKKTMQIFQILGNITAFYKEKGLYAEYETELEYVYSRILLCSSLSRMCRIPDAAIRKVALRENWSLLQQVYPAWRRNPVLRSQKSRHALFMRSINGITYKAYGIVLPFVYSVSRRMSRKWK